MNKFDFNRRRQTQGFKKLWEYFKAIIKSESFQKELSVIRQQHIIPKKRRYPDGIVTVYEPFRNWAKLMCKKYDLSAVEWEDSFIIYAYYGKLIEPEMNVGHLCLLTDLKEERDDPFSKDVQDDDDRYFPIGIRINPYASQRDILDYIKRIYPAIRQMQDKYKNKYSRIGRFKKRNLKKERRNDFIYNIKNLRLKKIAMRVGKKFNEELDEGHIGKIISLERKRRKGL